MLYMWSQSLEIKMIHPITLMIILLVIVGLAGAVAVSAWMIIDYRRRRAP